MLFDKKNMVITGMSQMLFILDEHLLGSSAVLDQWFAHSEAVVWLSEQVSGLCCDSGVSAALQALVYHKHSLLSSSSGNWGPELNRPHCHNHTDKCWKKAVKKQLHSALGFDSGPINHPTFLLLSLPASGADKLILCLHSQMPETIKHWTYVCELTDLLWCCFSTPQIFKCLCVALGWKSGKDTIKVTKIFFFFFSQLHDVIELHK